MLEYSFKEKCEHIAVDYRRKLGGRWAFGPLSSADLLRELKITLISPNDVLTLTYEQRQHLATAADWSAAVIQRDPIVVLYNPAHSPARHEANMMHECSHIILNHPMRVLNVLGSSSARDPHDEAEAVYLGGCLQIPRRGLSWAIQKRMNVEQIAVHFGASIEMVRYRANMTGQHKSLTVLHRQ